MTTPRSNPPEFPEGASPSPPSPAATLLATFFGAGYFPWGPGTVASLAAVLIAWLLSHYGGAGNLALLGLGVASFFAGVWASGKAAAQARRKDPGFVVIDEACGQWLTLAGCPEFNLKYLLLGLLMFRLFDILKPPPVRQAERLPRGWGIMADDVAAGLLGALVLAIAGWFNL